MPDTIWPIRALGFAAPVLIALTAGCAAPDIEGWRKTQLNEMTAHLTSQETPSESANETMERIAATRDSMDLAASRVLALMLVQERADDKQALFLASRSESDAVFLFPADDTEDRNLAALSALDYARRMEKAGGNDAQSTAQLAWALGTSTHLQPMFSRAGHATETLEVIQRALAERDDEPTALATLAILNLRLATLPWIANLMAFGAPDGSLEEAEKAGRHACEVRPSVENRIILAKCLIAAEKQDEAAKILEEALHTEAVFPRDRVLRPQASELLAKITAE